VRGWRHILSSLAVLGVIALGVPAVALASSAGDQQYIDPLAGSGSSTSTPATTHASAPATAPVSSTAATPAGSPSATTASASATTTAPSSSTGTPTAASSSGTLPYTGLNVGLGAALGAGLLGAGCAVRRLARST
jgi:hypothetical protein